MPRLQDFLKRWRFRPAGAPGAAARAGVPVDRSAEAAAELEPVLAQLAEVQTQCARIRAEADQEARSVRERAVGRAATILAEARARTEAERAGAAVRVRAQADAEAASLIRAAERQAAALREQASTRMPGYVDRVVAMVLTAGAADDAEAGGGRPA